MSELGLAMLARVISPSGYRNPDQVFALLAAYFDKSSDSPEGITSVAGYVATLDEWTAVEEKWETAVDEWSKLEGFRRLGGFHFVELEREIGHENAELCIKHFSNIITGSNLQAIGAAILDVDWKRCDWPKDYSTTRLGTLYEQCLDLALEILGRYSSKDNREDRLRVVCCQDGPPYCIEEVFDRKKARFPAFGPLAIGTRQDFRVLECADLGAGCLRLSWRAIAQRQPAAEFLSWGALPTGTGTRPITAFWSLRQGAVLSRALRIESDKRNR